MVTVALRYDLRTPHWAPTTHRDLYATAVEQAAWADANGIEMVTLSEHHGTSDGFMSAPVTLAAAIAARTERMLITIAAALIPLHDPVRLAEQITAVDLISGGRLAIVAGIGYRQEEFDMAEVERRGRGKLLEEYIDVMRRCWSGEPFEWRGRTIVATPTPVSQPHPIVLIGGSSEVAARRAARMGLPFVPAIGDPDLAAIYTEECERVGFDGGWVQLPKGPGFVHVTHDVDKAWEVIGPHALHDAQTYASWQTPGQRSAVHTEAASISELREGDVYKVVTPDECVALATELGPEGNIVLHPLLAGMDPDLGWESLHLFADEVLPRIRPT